MVIGHGMVGHYFLEQLVARELHQQYEIVVFGEERLPAYDRVHLSEYFAGRSAASLSLVSEGFFADHGITLCSASKIVAIDSQQRCVRDEQGVETHYDKLVLATGSYAFVPPISGNTRPAVWSIARWTIWTPLLPARNRPKAVWSLAVGCWGWKRLTRCVSWGWKPTSLSSPRA